MTKTNTAPAASAAPLVHLVRLALPQHYMAWSPRFVFVNPAAVMFVEEIERPWTASLVHVVGLSVEVAGTPSDVAAALMQAPPVIPANAEADDSRSPHQEA